MIGWLHELWGRRKLVDGDKLLFEKWAEAVITSRVERQAPLLRHGRVLPRELAVVLRAHTSCSDLVGRRSLGLYDLKWIDYEHVLVLERRSLVLPLVLSFEEGFFTTEPACSERFADQLLADAMLVL